MGCAGSKARVAAEAGVAEVARLANDAAAKCAFPEGAVRVFVTRGNPISEEARATLLPPRNGGDFTGERAVWKGKFCIE